MKAYILSATLYIIFSFMALDTNGQSVITPEHAYWQAGTQTVSLSKAYNEGVDKPDKLTFVMFFDQNLLNKYQAGDLTFEFTWFHYYSTQKEYMDSYTVKYDRSNITDRNKYSISSARENILSGWWEVRVKARYDNKDVNFQGLDKFQIYVK